MEQLVATSAEKCLEAPCRALLQASPPVGVEDKATTTGSVTHEEVDTPAGLLAALQKGVDHVVVVNHLDLTSLPSISSSITGSSSDALLLADSTKSIRGDCSSTTEPPNKDWLRQHPRATTSQCVLRSPLSFLEVPESTDATAEPHRLWLDNLYVTTTTLAADEEPPLTPPTLVTVAAGSQLWMTNIALIGGKRKATDSDNAAQPPAQVSRGMHAMEGSSVFARNVTIAFHEWDGAAAARLDAGSSLTAADAAFSDCTGASVITSGPPSMLSADGTGPNSAPRSFGGAPLAAPGPASASTSTGAEGPQGLIADEEDYGSVDSTDDTDPDSEGDQPPRQNQAEDERPPRQLFMEAAAQQQQQRRRRLLDSPEATPSSWVWLENVELARNNVEAPDSGVTMFPLEDADEVAQIRTTGVSPAAVYSNQAHLFYSEATERTVVPKPLADEAFVSGGFLSEEDPWFLETESEAVEATGVPVLQVADATSTAAFSSVTEPDLAPQSQSRHIRGRASRFPVLVPAIIAAIMVGVVAMVLLWRWTRSIRRKSKPPSQKKTFHGPLMPQSSARIPKLLKTMSIANNNLGLHQSGSPLANAALTRDSHPFLTASSLEDNAAVSPMAFQTSVVQTHGQGSFSSRNNEAQPTSEANISTPNSAKQARRGMFSNSTLTPFNGSPSFGQQASHSRRSSLSQQYSENPGLRAGASRSLTDSLYATAVETLGERDGSMLMNGTSVFIEPQSWSESTTVEIARVAPSKPWAKRHLFQSGASKLLGSRGGSISGHVATQEELEEALTQMSRFSEPLLDVYHVLSPAQRKCGASGQTIAQAVRRNADGAEFVAKFYLDRELFDREDNLRANPAFFKLLPPARVREPNGGARLRAPNGCVFPPFVIVDNGVSLKDWCDMEPRSFAVKLEALCALAKELETLHEAGLAHRGLHPRNVLWLPIGQRWTAVDFGNAAQIGRSAPLHVNRPYTPPEATLAQDRGRSDIVVEASADMWALGVIAHEVITGTPVVAPPSARDEVPSRNRENHDPLGLDAACDAATGAAAAVDSHQLLGPLAATVYSCLSSEPSARPTASDVLQAWQNMLAHMALSE